MIKSLYTIVPFYNTHPIKGRLNLPSHAIVVYAEVTPSSDRTYRSLSDVVKELHNLTPRTVVINSKLSLVRSARIALGDPFLGSPKDCLIVSMRRRYVAERGFRYWRWRRLVLEAPDKAHDLAACAGVINGSPSCITIHVNGHYTNISFDYYTVGGIDLEDMARLTFTADNDPTAIHEYAAIDTLLSANITTTEDLVELTKEEVCRIPGMTTGEVVRIEKSLASRGLFLRTNIPGQD